jgi:hypothetical protein
MGAFAGGLTFASGVQGGDAHAAGYETIVIVVAIVVLALAALAIGSYLRRRYRQPKSVSDQWQALSVMGELCPLGWQAEITVYGGGAPVPDDAPSLPVVPVELEWKQFDASPGQVVVTRRVWAPSIPEALQTMVVDRQTDLTLEQIERAAAADGEVWQADRD